MNLKVGDKVWYESIEYPEGREATIICIEYEYKNFPYTIKLDNEYTRVSSDAELTTFETLKWKHSLHKFLKK